MSTYSPSLRVELITSGDQAGTWGTTTNDNFAYVFDTAIAGYQTVSVTSANQALTFNNGPISTAALNQSVYAMLRLTTTTAAAFSVYAPPVSKQYIIWNNSGYAATIYNSTVIGNTTAAGAGITIADGDKVLVWSDGTNFYEIKSTNVTGVVAIANGGTGATTLTGLLLGNGTSAVTTVTAPSGTVVGTIDTQTLTNKRVTPRIGSVTSASTITPTGDSSDQYNVTALAVPASVAAPSGTPTDGQKLILRLEDDGTARALTWTTTSGAYRAIGTTLPTTTVATKTTYVGCIYNATDVFWDVVAVTTQA